MNPINFNIYAYLNSYINRFRTVTDKNITVQDLHEALRTLGVKTINGTSLYDKQTLENLVTNKRFINKLRAYFNLPPIERPTPINNPAIKPFLITPFIINIILFQHSFPLRP